MTSPTRTRSSAAPLAALAGVVVLAGMVAFAVGLPEAEGDSGTTPSAGTTSPGGSDGSTPPLPESITLPAELPGGLLASTNEKFPTASLGQGVTPEAIATQVEAARTGLEELYGDPSAFELYGDAEGTSGGTITVAPGAAGVYLPQGPPIAEEGAARSTVVSERVDGAVCTSGYGAAVPEGQPVPDDAPQSVNCELAQDGLVYQFSGGGISAADVVSALHAFADAQG